MTAPTINGTPAATKWTGSTSSGSHSLTIPGGLTDSCLLVGLGFQDTQANESFIGDQTVKWGGSGGTALTLVTSSEAERQGNSRTIYTAWFYLLNPTAQSSTVYWSTSAQQIRLGAITAIVLENVGSTPTAAVNANTFNSSSSADATITGVDTNGTNFYIWVNRNGTITNTVSGATKIIDESTGSHTSEDMKHVVAWEAGASGSQSATNSFSSSEIGAWSAVQIAGTTPSPVTIEMDTLGLAGSAADFMAAGMFTTYSANVAASSDDARQAGVGNAATLTDSAIVISSPDWGGFRFLSVPIAQGATIHSAFFIPYITSTANDDSNATINADDIDDAATFTTAVNDITGRTRTTSIVNWTASNLGVGYRASPDIKDVIQEVVDRVGCVSGNDLALLYDGLGSSNVSFGTYDGGNPAQLIINYVTDVTTVEMDVLPLAGSAVSLSVVPGAVSLLMDVLAGNGAAVDLSVAPGAISLLMDVLAGTASAVDLEVVANVAILLDTLTAAGTTVNLDVFSALSVLLDTLTATGTAESLGVSPGAVSLVMSALPAVGSAIDLTVSPGAVAVLLDVLEMAGAAVNLDVSTALVLLMDTLALAATADDLSVVPGGVSLLMDSLLLGGEAVDLSVSLLLNIVLSTLTLVATAETLTVQPGGVELLMNVLTAASSAVGLTVSPGAVELAMQTLAAVLEAQTLAVSAPPPVYEPTIYSSAYRSQTVSVTNDSLSFAVPAGLDDPALFVFLALLDDQQDTSLLNTHSVKWGGSGGVALALVPGSQSQIQTNVRTVYGAWFYLLNPTPQDSTIYWSTSVGQTIAATTLAAVLVENVSDEDAIGAVNVGNYSSSNAPQAIVTAETGASLLLYGWNTRNGTYSNSITGAGGLIETSTGPSATADAVAVVAYEATGGGSEDATTTFDAADMGVWTVVQIAGVESSDVFLTMDTLNLGGAAVSLIMEPGAVDLLMTTLGGELAAESLVVTPGAVSLIMQTLAGALSVIAVTAIEGGSFIQLNTLNVAGAAETLVVTPGDVALLMAVLGVVGSAENAAVAPGDVAVALSPAALVGGTLQLSVVQALFIAAIMGCALIGDVAVYRALAGDRAAFAAVIGDRSRYAVVVADRDCC